MKKATGFTLMELMIVTAGILVLALVVTFSLISAQQGAYRIAAKADMQAVIPILIACHEAGGPTSGYVPESYFSGADICDGRYEFKAKWPILRNGWDIATYRSTDGTVSLGTFTYRAIKEGQSDIECSMVTKECE